MEFEDVKSHFENNHRLRPAISEETHDVQSCQYQITGVPVP